LALSDEGDLYGWGANSYGQLGTGNKANSCSPTRVAEDIGRVIDIAASHYNHISAAITQDSTVYMWGQCHGQSVVLPTPTSFHRLHEVFACFATPAVTPVPMITEISSVPNILDSLKLAFDDTSTADVKFVVDGKDINVHKSILKIRCEHFRSMFQVTSGLPIYCLGLWLNFLSVECAPTGGDERSKPPGLCLVAS
jgi:RCC1 and BTB domain-containing protein